MFYKFSKISLWVFAPRRPPLCQQVYSIFSNFAPRLFPIGSRVWTTRNTLGFLCKFSPVSNLMTKWDHRFDHCFLNVLEFNANWNLANTYAKAVSYPQLCRMTRIAYSSMNSTLMLFLSQPLLHKCYTICIRPWEEWFTPPSPLPLRYLIEKREWALLSLFFSHSFSPTFPCGFPLSKNDYDWRPSLFLSMLRWFQQRSPV